MLVFFDLALALFGVPVLVCAGYLGLLTLLSRRLPVPSKSESRKRFRIVIPAHDEAAGISKTIKNLSSLDYPPCQFDLLVVADNCKDDTAEIARRAGAAVLERKSETERGKGYALHYAFEKLPDNIDAAVVIDADTVVSPNLLAAFAARLDAGADAVQADYAVSNPNASWRTRLIAIAFGAFHIVRSRARERLGVSAGLRGNGMCFTTRVLRDVPHAAYSIVEDVEYGIRLAEAGHRVFYADEAHVYGEMVSGAAAATSQRQRWEGGRLALARKYGRRLLSLGLSGNRMLLDLAFDVLVPPLSKVAVSALLGLVLALAGSFFLGGFRISLVVFGLSVASIVCYVLRGWAVSGTGVRGLVDLALAPWYVVWRATLARKMPVRDGTEWVRTTREAKAESTTPDP